MDKIITIQRVVKKQHASHIERIKELERLWDHCLDSLRFEYIEDKEEKDRHSQNLFRNLKLLSDNVKREEIKIYYRKTKHIYNSVYFDWRELTRSVVYADKGASV